jgi:flagellar biosynthesis anti-sigma factor FlgM
MKINGDTPGVLTGATDQLGKTPETTTFASGKADAAAARGDQLTLSSDAKVMQAAAEQASQAPAIRQDVVARMRELVDKGEVGNDAARLADALIDDWLNRP